MLISFLTHSLSLYLTLSLPHACAPLAGQVRRKMEDENRKARRAARRDFHDNVRELVAFVRKRDKRVAVFQVRAARVRRAVGLRRACGALWG